MLPLVLGPGLVLVLPLVLPPPAQRLQLAPLLVQAVMKGQVEPEVHSHLYCEVGQMRAVFSTDWRLIYAPQIRPVGFS